jgi:transcriptional regulator with XRE-family HTH domain
MSRGRGRPYRPPLDSSPWSSVSGGAGARTGWLLGTSRMLNADGAYANRQEFLPRLLERDIRVDNTRLSRWESGTASVSPQVIEAYEDILGLPAQQLRSTVSLLTGHSAAPTSAEDPTAAEHTLDGLVEGVLGGERSCGDTWVRLTGELAKHPSIYLRSSLWRSLAGQLISELSRSVGVAYTARLSALHRLIAHPMAHNDVIAAIGQYVTDPHAVRVDDVIAALAHAPSNGSRVLALGLLASGDPALEAGAARTIAAMGAAHTWSGTLDGTLEKHLVEVLGGVDRAELIQVSGSADLLRYLEPTARERVLAGLGEDRQRQFVLEHVSLISPASASMISANVTAAAQQSVPMLSDAPDAMLERLVREALFHAHAERRHRAAVLLAASPYAAGIGAASAGLLNADDPIVGRRAAELLKFCITPAETAHVLHSPVERAGHVQAAAISSLGHVPELADHVVDDVIERTAPWSAEHHTHAALYVLGMHGATDRLAAHDVPPHVESGVAWWRRTGSRVAV